MTGAPRPPRTVPETHEWARGHGFDPKRSGLAVAAIMRMAGLGETFDFYVGWWAVSLRCVAGMFSIEGLCDAHDVWECATTLRADARATANRLIAAGFHDVVGTERALLAEIEAVLLEVGLDAPAQA